MRRSADEQVQMPLVRGGLPTEPALAKVLLFRSSATLASVASRADGGRPGGAGARSMTDPTMSRPLSCTEAKLEMAIIELTHVADTDWMIALALMLTLESE